MVLHGLNFPPDKLAMICQRYGARRLSLFGSILRDDFFEFSDVDMLVEFMPQTRIGLMGMAHMEEELTQAIGRRVDLRTPGDLSRHFRDRVLSHARLLHAA